MASLSDLFPGLPDSGGIISDAGSFFDGFVSFFGGSGPSEQSIVIGGLVKTVLNGPGVQSMYEAQRATRRQVRIQNELAGQAHELVARLETAWTGPSNLGAQRTIRSFADVADDSSRVLQSNERNIERQVDTFERMKNSMEPMADPPPRKGAFDPDFSGAKKKRIRKYEQQAERNRQRYSTFVDETNRNKDDLDGRYGDMPEIDYGDGGGYNPPSWNPGQGGGAGGGIPPVRTPGGSPGWNPGSIGGVGSGVGVGDYNAPDFERSGYGGTSAAAAYGPGGAGAGGGAGLGAGGLPGGGAAGMTGAGADGMAFGGQSGVAAGAGTGAGAGGAGAGGAGAGGAGAGRGGGAGGRGAGGMMGGGGAGGGRGQGSDDDEHQRKGYLQENDPEGLFGSDELTAPPVIGDDDYE